MKFHLSVHGGLSRHDGFGIGVETFPVGHRLWGAIVMLGLWSAWLEVDW